MDARALFGDSDLVKQRLPIHQVIPDLLNALKKTKRAVLSAPPGAGKTTFVPIALLQSGMISQRIIMLEPRRLAARAAAERMAEMLGEPIGKTVGYRIRGTSKTSAKTRIEVVTEGILTRMLQSDPSLTGIEAIIFDEFHERSLNADLGLALSLEVASALRQDMHLLVMSATLDAGEISKMLGNAPVIISEGLGYPVKPIWLDQPLNPKVRFDNALTNLVLRAIAETSGGVLVFVPGEAEIHRLVNNLRREIPNNCILRPLFSAMSFADQRQAIVPSKRERKIVLATALAETSLTIEDIRVVVDGGRARRAQFDPGTGMSRLITERVTKAEATQRMGRAGRVAEGSCYKLWSKPEEGAMRAYPPAEIETADLTRFALELASWGASLDQLSLITPPNGRRLKDAQRLLFRLSALDEKGKITNHGKAIAKLPIHPRLAHMLIHSGPRAAYLAALLNDRDPLERAAPSDLTLRLDALQNPKRFQQERPFRVERPILERIKSEARRLKLQCPDISPDFTPAQMVALAYPDRIAMRRKGLLPRYLLANGKGAVLSSEDSLSSQEFLVATDLDGDPKQALIRGAIAISEAEVRTLFASDIHWENICEWSRRERKVIARSRERLGAIVLADRIWKKAQQADISKAMLVAVRELGLPMSDAAHRFLARVRLGGCSMPDVSENVLINTIEEWLLPYLGDIQTADDWRKFDLLPALKSLLTWSQVKHLDQVAPAYFTTPLNRRIPINYSANPPEISLRIQEMFGQKKHPMVGNKPLRVALLSPAGRPLQITTDLPTFWKNSYQDVRKDMRGRYPKHLWPEDPASTNPTLATKKKISGAGL